MKFFTQNKKIPHLSTQNSSSNEFTLTYQKKSEKESQNLNFSPENTCQINQLKIEIPDSKSMTQKPKIEDLIKAISNLSKTQINLSPKLFLQLGLLLSSEPEKISEIKVDKGFLRSFIEFTSQLKSNGRNTDENRMKVYRLCLNSLLYILMLLLSADKPIHRNEEFKQMLFGSKAFLKHFLGIEIHKNRQTSKLYGIIVIHIYKQNLSLDVKKCLVSSIIKNLKYVEHEKTELNLTMILNELRFSYKLKSTLVKQENLINRIEEILTKNSKTFQSVYAISYFLHLVYEFPQLSKTRVFKIERKVEITENIKSFAQTSKLFQKTYVKFFEWCNQQDCGQLFSLSQTLLSDLVQISKLQSKEKNNINGGQKRINFLLELIQILLKYTSHKQNVPKIIEDGLFRTLIEFLKRKKTDEITKNKIYEVLEVCMLKVKTISNQLHQGLLNFLQNQLMDTEDIQSLYYGRRLKIMTNKESSNLNQCPSYMELE